MPPDPLGILLISGSYERAHYAFMLAAGAGAIGRRVVLFATNCGTHALCRDWSALADITDAESRSRGVVGLDELRDAAAELGTELMACDSGLRLAAVDPAALLPGVAVGGIPAFLSALGSGQVITL